MSVSMVPAMYYVVENTSASGLSVPDDVLCVMIVFLIIYILYELYQYRKQVFLWALYMVLLSALLLAVLLFIMSCVVKTQKSEGFIMLNDVLVGYILIVLVSPLLFIIAFGLCFLIEILREEYFYG